jgi:hypothetical protein
LLREEVDTLMQEAHGHGLEDNHRLLVQLRSLFDDTRKYKVATACHRAGEVDHMDHHCAYAQFRQIIVALTDVRAQLSLLADIGAAPLKPPRACALATMPPM